MSRSPFIVRGLAFLALVAASACNHAPPTDPFANEPRPSSDEPISLGLVPMEGVAEQELDSEFCDPDADERPVPDHRLYATWQTFPLKLAEHGVEGTMRVLQDSRFTNGAPRHGTNALVRPCDPLPGRIEILDAKGALVEANEVSPQTDVTAYAVAAGQTVYEIRSRVLCLASCWCGDHVRYERVVGGRLVPLETTRSSGKVAPVRGVTRGCYEGGAVEQSATGRPEIHIHRTVLVIPDAVYVDERHFWDGSAWKTTAHEQRRPW